MRIRRLVAGLTVAAFVVLGASTPAAAATPTTVSARTLLSQLKTTSEQNSGYDRDKFNHWVDADKDRQDTRDEVLIAESKATVKYTSSSKTDVASGKWVSAYDGKTITNPSQIDIDHMVPLAEAWGSGARNWNTATRQAYANDLGYNASLVAVSASSNRAKGASDPAQWMPPASSNTCQYARNWVAVKWRWDLSVDNAEKSKLSSTLATCAKSGKDQVAKPAKAKVVTNGTTSTPAPKPPSSSRNDPRFSTCTDAKSRGYGPYKKGSDPEYDWYRDGDSDGIACE